MGEDIATAAGGAFKCTEGLLDTFGPKVIDTPISEMGSSAPPSAPQQPASNRSSR